MLNDLCHNEQHGPHNAQFYNLLDEIRKRTKKLVALGKDLSLVIILGQTALAAAESRAHHRVN
ncbi:hypothetical protein AAZX31_13G353000 [Glycine max]|nr:hypothetical protein JHK85_039124 [Glycine max]KAG5115108.1 hypothetical protein JHK82_038377 [Glycine max]KAG5132381.1 hypothetical protein JHK84_038778 [Glycine max]KAH1219603.1 hypothetical protein GmHk_13G039678 [Glycine max]